MQSFSDNQNIVRTIQVGSRNPKLHVQAEAMKIFGVSLAYSVKIGTKWVPREQDHVADYLSRKANFDDWGINPHVA